MPTRKTEPSTKPFQLALLCGANPLKAEVLADKAIDLTAGSLLEAVEKFKQAPLKTTDLRAKSIFMVDHDAATALVQYALMVGFSGRFVDIATPAGVVSQVIRQKGVKTADNGKAPEREESLTLAGGIDELGEEPGYIYANGALAHLSLDEISEIRSAKRVRFAPSETQDIFTVMTQFMYTAGLRARKGFERLPVLVWGGAEIDLDDMRRMGADIRKSQTSYKLAIAPALPPSERQRRMLQASQFPVEGLLSALGCSSAVVGEQRVLWQCPRPQSHTHGDATPSMQVSDNKVRCYVDDAEWIDPLRLVMEACGVTPDEAAGMLASPPSVFSPFAHRIVAERALRSGELQPGQVMTDDIAAKVRGGRQEGDVAEHVAGSTAVGLESEAAGGAAAAFETVVLADAPDSLAGENTTVVDDSKVTPGETASGVSER